MGKLNEKQRRFTHMLGILILFAYATGYELTMGESYDDDGIGHTKSSTHYVRLAQDFNVFKDGVYLSGKAAREAHSKLHDFWDSIGGAKRIEADLNHYSFEWQGVR